MIFQRAQAEHCVFTCIHIWCNTTRLHSSLGHKSPAQFERDGDTQSTKAASDIPIIAPINNSNPFG
jgi:hypothetical protein